MPEHSADEVVSGFSDNLRFVAAAVRAELFIAMIQRSAPELSVTLPLFPSRGRGGEGRGEGGLTRAAIFDPPDRGVNLADYV